MAIPAQGLTITWGTAALSEVRQIDIQQDRGQPQQRFGTWTLSLGTVRLAGFSTAAVPESDYGIRRTLSVVAPVAGTLFSKPCVFEDRQIQIEANDAVRFDTVFRIVD